MSRKFSFKFNLLISILTVVAGILSAVMLVFNILRLNDPNSNVLRSVQATYIAVSAILLAAVLVVLLFSKYRLKNNVIKVTIGFVPVLAIPYSSIAKFVLYPKTEEFFVIYQKNGEMKTHMLCLSGDDAGKLMDSVSEIYPDIFREKIM